MRALDALQLASALVARGLFAAPEMRFIASDHELLKAAQADDFPTWKPGLVLPKGTGLPVPSRSLCKGTFSR